GCALFLSHKNSLLIASAPPERRGSASGMLATARLTGQTTGAALMALLFHTLPDASTRAALFVAAAAAAVGSGVSFLRLSLPLPEALVRRKPNKV
ncbi:MAG: MFS transporter, partial [Alistipes sp.]|nr:MFS transporter [Alistipes sp.]